ncbi:MAG: M48 family metallopeptidase [Burkholderiaceae bacterium]
MIACRYFDGVSSRAIAASVVATNDGVRITGGGVDRIVDRVGLSFAPSRGNAPSRIAFDDGALCEIPDRAAAESLFAALGHRADFGDRIASHRSTLALVVAGFISISAALYLWGVPLAADAITRAMPAEWQRTFGVRVLYALEARGIFQPSTLSAERRDRLRLRAQQMKFVDERPTFDVIFRRFKVPNAFALPGEFVVVSDELVALAKDDDAVLTVIAHEIGHIAHRDAMRGLMRATLLSALATWYVGDASTIAATVAGGLGGLHYTRHDEHEADLFALRQMQANHVSTQSAADLFRSLMAWQPTMSVERADRSSDVPPDAKKEDVKKADAKERVRIPVYLSTHPATEARIRMFESGVASDE